MNDLHARIFIQILSLFLKLPEVNKGGWKNYYNLYQRLRKILMNVNALKHHAGTLAEALYYENINKKAILRKLKHLIWLMKSKEVNDLDLNYGKIALEREDITNVELGSLPLEDVNAMMPAWLSFETNRIIMEKEFAIIEFLSIENKELKMSIDAYSKLLHRNVTFANRQMWLFRNSKIGSIEFERPSFDQLMESHMKLRKES